ncbi:MAG: RNA methyltransferase [Treponema sp.]|nr:RNA methyltransferase [Treponema sp.]
MLNKLTDELAICGFNAVMALAEHNPDQINRFFLREDRMQFFTKTCKALAERKRPYKICEDEELERICKTSHHQGVVAMIILPKIEPLNTEDLEDWSNDASAGLLLHSIGNDHNLGAIIRSAAFFDVRYIILSEIDTEARLTTSAYRIAEGGMEHVQIRSVRNIEAFLRDAGRKLLTLGTDIRARRKVGDLPKILQERQKVTGGGRPGIVLVLGNEETGLPEEIKTGCQVLLRIPGTGLMESLNVAQAATLFMHRIFEL